MKDDIVIVTGAAGGIGRALVAALTDQGYVVAALDLNGEGLKNLAAAPAKGGRAPHVFPVDVADCNAVEETVAQVERTLGPVDNLVNAAGVLRLGTVLDYSDAKWKETFAVNVEGVFYVTRATVSRMVPRGHGSVVTVASNAAHTPRSGMAAYAASKAAATMFTKSLGLEVARSGIRCNVVAPGSTDTPMLTSMWHDDSGRGRTIAGDPDAFRTGIPLGKLARPTDIADAVTFLLSDRASHITLHELTVDGGATLGV